MIIKEERLSDIHKEEVWRLVETGDKEFVPPLSSRHSTTQQTLAFAPAENSPTAYFNGLMEQKFILCIEDQKTVGFMSYIEDHLLTAGTVSYVCDYVTTVIISPDHRNKGYAQKMYLKLFESGKSKRYATRTWSTNVSHITILKKLGFKLVSRIKNDRGEGIDTVYYLREDHENEQDKYSR